MKYLKTALDVTYLMLSETQERLHHLEHFQFVELSWNMQQRVKNKKRCKLFIFNGPIIRPNRLCIRHKSTEAYFCHRIKNTKVTATFYFTIHADCVSHNSENKKQI